MMNTARARNFFGLSFVEVFWLLLFSAGIGFYLTSRHDTTSAWALVGISFSVFVLGQAILMANRGNVFPQLICINVCGTWIIAPWLAYYHPHPWPVFQMSIPMNDYMTYATPASFALWFGIHLPLRTSAYSAHNKSPISLTSRERRLMDGLIVFGFVIEFLSYHMPLSLQTMFYILSLLRFVGALTYMFSASRGWRFRIVLVYTGLFIRTTSGAVFYEFILWSAYLLISLAYLYKWRWKLLIYLIAGFYLALMLNNIKPQYRLETSNVGYISVLDKMTIFTKVLWKAGGYSSTGDVITDQLVRWNHGCIIAHVMNTVPASQPYAKGETIKQAIINSLLPRLFFPDKLRAASQEMYTTYTGFPLGETSMALGVSGEMYANFGLLGGILATAVYGFFIGFLFLRFDRLARQNSIIWAWVPFVMIAAFEPEWNVYDILNSLIKSLVVFVAVISLMPSLRTMFFNKVLRTVRAITLHKPLNETPDHHRE